jgi:hypothetical protein
LAGWWDASNPTYLNPTAGWREAGASIGNRVNAGPPLTAYRFIADDGLPAIYPHLSGLLGGLGRVLPTGGLLRPTLDPDQGFRVDMSSFAADSGWTWFFVWSRPNRRQGSFRDSDPIVLLRAGDTSIVSADSHGPQRRLILFPGHAPVVLTDNLSRRHTHSLIIRHAPGIGIDVWLDDTRVVTALSAAALAGPKTPVLFHHEGNFMGGAQCWFHEAATWSRSLNDTEIATVRTYANRWYRGPRKGVFLLFNGQSNAVNYTLNDGAADVLADGISWYLGVLATNFLATTGAPSNHSMQPGHGLYQVQGGLYPGSFLNDPMDASHPSTWWLGGSGLATQTALAAMNPEDRADIRAIIWPWNETDSLRSASEWPTFAAAASRFVGLEREMIGRGAAELPLIWWSAIPYGTAPGTAAHRLAVNSLLSQPALNVVLGNPQTADSNARGASWNELSGTATGGDHAHRDGDDNRRFARLATPVIARAIGAAGGADLTGYIPGSVPVRGGPRIIHAYRETSTQIVVTVEHDIGTDLLVPRLASQGKGFAVVQGDPLAQSPVVIFAAACERIDATRLRVTLAQPVTAPIADCSLHYPFGGESIWRGNAVTDNAAELAASPGWDITAQLGSVWSLNYPLSATLGPTPLSANPL